MSIEVEDWDCEWKRLFAGDPVSPFSYPHCIHFTSFSAENFCFV